MPQVYPYVPWCTQVCCGAAWPSLLPAHSSSLPLADVPGCSLIAGMNRMRLPPSLPPFLPFSLPSQTRRRRRRTWHSSALILSSSSGRCSGYCSGTSLFSALCSALALLWHCSGTALAIALGQRSAFCSATAWGVVSSAAGEKLPWHCAGYCRGPQRWYCLLSLLSLGAGRGGSLARLGRWGSPDVHYLPALSELWEGAKPPVRTCKIAPQGRGWRALPHLFPAGARLTVGRSLGLLGAWGLLGADASRRASRTCHVRWQHGYSDPVIKAPCQ